MDSWRLKWILKELCDLGRYRDHQRVLCHPRLYYACLLAKSLPRLWQREIVLELIQGGSFKVRDFMTLFIYKEVFVDRCYDVDFDLDDTPAILDVGANTGLFAIRMKQRFPRAKLVCFEPFPNNYRQLTENLELSRLEGVSPMMVGVGRCDETARLFVHPKNLGAHSLFPASKNLEFMDIPLVGLESALRTLDGQDCDLLKLDCEGAEHQILMSLTPELVRRVRNIVYEATPTLYDPSELASHLESLGYSLATEKGLYVARL